MKKILTVRFIVDEFCDLYLAISRCDEPETCSVLKFRQYCPPSRGQMLVLMQRWVGENVRVQRVHDNAGGSCWQISVNAEKVFTADIMVSGARQFGSTDVAYSHFCDLRYGRDELSVLGLLALQEHNLLCLMQLLIDKYPAPV